MYLKHEFCFLVTDSVKVFKLDIKSQPHSPFLKSRYINYLFLLLFLGLFLKYILIAARHQKSQDSSKMDSKFLLLKYISFDMLENMAIRQIPNWKLESDVKGGNDLNEISSWLNH